MNPVMIVGNGISRLLYRDEICAWTGEMWACNWIFEEQMRPPAPMTFGQRLTRLTGHVDVMEKADAWKPAHNGTFEIWSGHLGVGRPGWRVFTCPPSLRKDSGTTLVAQALQEKRPEIICVGFDLGGKDVLSENGDKADKRSWVMRWRTLQKVYSLQTVRFVGHDHKPFILDQGRDPREYARKYMYRQPHIPDPAYVALYNKFSDPPLREKPQPGDLMMLCRRKNGTTAKFKKDIAKALALKGEVVIIREVQR